jgi:hypothetical protein
MSLLDGASLLGAAGHRASMRLLLASVLLQASAIGAQGAVAAATKTDSARRASVASVLNPVYFGVPYSPAFELLPDKPGEVTHILTPKDFQSHVMTWHDGRQLRAGVALDTRPFISSAGDLASYARSWRRRVAFRSVLSAGTVLASEGASDVIFAGGLRVPLVDFGDARADTAYQDSLAAAYTRALQGLAAPPFGASTEALEARAAKAREALTPLRDSFAIRSWNKLKLDVGLAASGRASGGETSRDSLSNERAGVWTAMSLPVGPLGQLTLAGKSVWARTDTSTKERLRGVVGARLVVFANARVSASVEGARIWSRFRSDSLNDDWNHFGGLVEWLVPELGGWIGVSYGGDGSRREKTANKLSLHYALYKDRILQR